MNQYRLEWGHGRTSDRHFLELNYDVLAQIMFRLDEAGAEPVVSSDDEVFCMSLTVEGENELEALDVAVHLIRTATEGISRDQRLVGTLTGVTTARVVGGSRDDRTGPLPVMA